MKTYHCTLSDKSTFDVKADSASEAIYKALDRNRGLIVTACFSGNFIMDRSTAGQIHYDVPGHKPISQDAP